MNRPAFIEFDLWSNAGRGKSKLLAKRVVCFSSRKFAPCAVEIVGDQMPKTWHPAYTWDNLNILFEVFHEIYEPSKHRNNERYVVTGTNVIDLKNLHGFISAFGFNAGDRMFMHVWNSQIPI